MIVPILMAVAVSPVDEPMRETAPPAGIAEPCPLPVASWGAARSLFDNERPLVPVTLEKGSLSWDGRIVDEQALRTGARDVAGRKPRPRLAFHSSGDCVETRRIAALIASDARCTPGDCIALDHPLYITVAAPPAPPRAAPPVPPPPTGRKPRPTGSPQSWVTNDDYPAVPLRAGQHGVVAFRLYVDPAGVLEHCEVTASSGTPSLDDKTCSLLMERATFDPALDSEGKAVAATWSSRIRWELPEGYVPPPRAERTSWGHQLQFTIAEDGTASGCSDVYFGLPGIQKEDLCAVLREMPGEEALRMRGNSKGSVTIMFRNVHSVTGMPMDPVPKIPVEFRLIGTAIMTFELSETGDVGDCRVAWMVPVPSWPPPGCFSQNSYRPGQGKTTVTLFQSGWTTGDPNLPPPDAAGE